MSEPEASKPTGQPVELVGKVTLHFKLIMSTPDELRELKRHVSHLAVQLRNEHSADMAGVKTVGSWTIEFDGASVAEGSTDSTERAMAEWADFLAEISPLESRDPMTEAFLRKQMSYMQQLVDADESSDPEAARREALERIGREITGEVERWLGPPDNDQRKDSD